MPKKIINKMNWVANKEEAIAMIRAIGARNLTAIQPVRWDKGEYEDYGNSYSKMIEHNSDEADAKAIIWVQDMHHENSAGSYIYFNLKRY